MIDREKVIKGLECLAQKQEPTANPCKGCGYIDKPNFAICVKDVASDALEILKEKEAVEARKKNDGKPQPWTSWWYVCGDCGQEIEYHDRFCRWCGRTVKWNG